MARKKLPPELKAKNYTFKLYDWEVDKVKSYIQSQRMYARIKNNPDYPFTWSL
jgi:hypothetical protein